MKKKYQYLNIGGTKILNIIKMEEKEFIIDYEFEYNEEESKFTSIVDRFNKTKLIADDVKTLKLNIESQYSTTVYDVKYKFTMTAIIAHLKCFLTDKGIEQVTHVSNKNLFQIMTGEREETEEEYNHIRNGIKIFANELLSIKLF